MTEICDYTENHAALMALLPNMFAIIAENMRAIAPTGNTLEEDRQSWMQAMQGELQRPEKHWALAFSGEFLAGYTLYCIKDHVCAMDEIQVARQFQGDGETFWRLMAYLLRDARRTRTLQSYANRRNKKSQGILRRMGLAVMEETPRGSRYEGKTEDALAWFLERGHNEIDPPGD